MKNIRTFNNVHDLLKYAQKEVTKTLQQKESNVKNVAVSEFAQSVQGNVYAAYTSPAENPYIRQMDHGGLTDRDNFRVEDTGDGVAISSSRQGTDGLGNRVDVLEIIEGNAPYSITDKWGYGYEEPRDAVLPAADKLRRGTSLKTALKLDLQNRGFEVK